MIKLDICEYCQECMEFDPRVTRRPEQLHRNDGECFVFGDTIVKCEHSRHCEALYNYLKKENGDDND